jgi:hypothetical protein
MGISRESLLQEFVAWASDHIRGDEKGEAQIFLGPPLPRLRPERLSRRRRNPRAAHPQRHRRRRRHRLRRLRLNQIDSPKGKVKLADLPTGWGPLAFLFPTRELPTFGNNREKVTREAGAWAAGQSSHRSDVLVFRCSLTVPPAANE